MSWETGDDEHTQMVVMSQDKLVAAAGGAELLQPRLPQQLNSKRGSKMDSTLPKRFSSARVKRLRTKIKAATFFGLLFDFTGVCESCSYIY